MKTEEGITVKELKIIVDMLVSLGEGDTPVVTRNGTEDEYYDVSAEIINRPRQGNKYLCID